MPFYRFTMGNVVQLAYRAPIQRVAWWGKQLVPDAKGRLYEVPVYRLDNGYWDCYHEENLHSALRWDLSGVSGRKR